MNKILFFEPDYRGHQKEYIKHICKYLESENIEVEATFLVHPVIRNQMSELGKIDQAKFRVIEEQDAKICNEASLISKDRMRWECVTKGVRKTGADHVHFLQIDPVQLSLSLRRSLPEPCTISGILFKPSIHYSPLWDDDRSWREYGRDVRKSILYDAMLRNPRLSVLLTLDPYFPAYAEGNITYGNKVKWVCDPVNPVEPSVDTIPSSAFSNERTTFLIFGSLAKRKGIFEVLDALSHIPETVRKRLSIVFAGRLRNEVRTHFKSRIRKVKQDFSGVEFHLEDRFLPEDELAGWVSRADVILAPYQRVMGSSGTLLWASSFQKPILTQSYGLIGKYVRDNNLGLTVKSTSPPSIAKGIESFACTHEHVFACKSSMKKIAQKHNPREFAKTVIDSVLHKKHP